MIPDHLIDKAWRAYTWANSTQAIRNELAYPDLRGPMPPPPDPRLSMRAALEAVTAEIWQGGYDSGVHDEFTSQDWTGREVQPNRKNPYKASEDA